MFGQYRPPILVILIISYLALMLHNLHHDSLPQPRCKQVQHQPHEYDYCHHPLLLPGDEIELNLWLFQPYDDEGEPDTASVGWTWKPVETCRQLRTTVPIAGALPTELTELTTSNCTVLLPEFSRIRWSSHSQSSGAVLQAKFVITHSMPSMNVGARHLNVIAEVPFELTRIVKQRSNGIWDAAIASSKQNSQPRKLLDSRVDSDKLIDNANNMGETTADFVPHLKYGKQPLLIRFVGEYRPYGGPPPLYRRDGTVLSVPLWNRTSYLPTVYVDDTSLLQSSKRELAVNGMNRPPIHLRIKLSAISPLWHTINLQVMGAMQIAESILPGEELDEIRYFLQDERLNRLFWTQVVSWIHLWLDYLAFRDEVRFYRGRTEMSGVSVSSVVTQLLCSWIIFLYLLDGGGTSWVVLFSVLSSVVVDAWKVWKLLRPEFQFSYPFVKLRQIRSQREQETAQYDEIAVKYLCMFLYPMVAGWSLFALYHYTYQSWYSWFISNLANAVYTFGFISLCPQLYINYRLKSVAHLPWKVFLYKIFNTFVDDFFAWMIDMPWKHRIMTLRDDVVFAIFLLQVYWYRVDLTRTNEFGYAYDANDDDDDSKEDKIKRNSVKRLPNVSHDASMPKEKMN